ncbi:hypothetical protein [Novosphingobium terrae]|nr:hypothetical protein [Novosphingobium terrae]
MDDHNAVYHGGTSLAYAGTQNMRGSSVGDVWRNDGGKRRLEHAIAS